MLSSRSLNVQKMMRSNCVISSRERRRCHDSVSWEAHIIAVYVEEVAHRLESDMRGLFQGITINSSGDSTESYGP